MSNGEFVQLSWGRVFYILHQKVIVKGADVGKVGVYMRTALTQYHHQDSNNSIDFRDGVWYLGSRDAADQWMYSHAGVGERVPDGSWCHRKEPTEYVEVASRPLVVLIHGFAGESSVFSSPERSRYLQFLDEAGFDVLCFDNYGHGFSDGPDLPYSAELYASQLSELLVALDIRSSFHLLGFSLGGSVATVFAARFPHRVQRLVLQAPAVVARPFPLAIGGLLRTPFLAEIAVRLLVPNFGEGANIGNSAVCRACHRLMLTNLRSGGVFLQDARTSLLQLLQRLPPEVLISVIWGDADKAVPYEDSTSLVRCLGGRLTLIRVQGADHMTFADGSEDVRKIFRSHLLGVLSAPRPPSSL